MGITLGEGDGRHTAFCDPHHTIAMTRIGGHAYRYLVAEPRAGRVVSLFRNGLNVAFDDGETETWISIQMSVVSLHPWAVEVEAVPSGIEVDALVTSDREGVRLGTSFLSLHEARIDDLRIRPYTSEEAERALSRLPLLEQFLADAQASCPTDPFQSQIAAILARWQTSGDPSLLAGLIGLGSGSTPSGDDVLVGLLAGLAAQTPARSDHVASSVSGFTLSARTTRPAEQMVLAAAEGSFPEPLCLLIVALAGPRVAAEDIGERVRAVARLGASSGPSLLRGLAAALRS